MSNLDRAVQQLHVSPSESIQVTDETYPWINTAQAEIPTIAVSLEDGTSFIYGSLIGLNKSIMRIAESVSPSDSVSLQTVLFNGLPSVLRGVSGSGMSRVENSQHLTSTLFIASRNLARMPGLIFAVKSSAENAELPVVLRAGVSSSAERTKLLRLLGVNALSNSRRKSS